MAGLNIGNAPFWLSNQDMISKNEFEGTIQEGIPCPWIISRDSSTLLVQTSGMTNFDRTRILSLTNLQYGLKLSICRSPEISTL
jgi:hypothetical protein